MSGLLKFIKQVDLTDYTLLIPSVSVGNVPQLTVDIIITTYNLQRIGILWHPAIIPSVGGDPFKKDSTELTTACELYANEDLKLAVIQLRSSIEPRYANAFFKLLISTIQDLKVKALVVLASAFAHEMHDVKSSMFRYLMSGDILSKELLQEHSIQQGAEEELHPGTGFALKLFKLAKEKNINCLLLGKYSSEGDNRPDAVQMLQVLWRLFTSFKLDDNKEFSLDCVKFPSSWDHVFGNAPPLGIY